MPSTLPPLWTDEQLAADAAVSQAAIIDRILGASRYRSAFPEFRDAVDTLLELTNSLREIDPQIFVERPNLIPALRFCFGPPLSNDTVKEQVGGSVKVKRLPDDRAEATVDLIRQGLDPLRFPWIADQRSPSGYERQLALDWTAGLMTVENARTDARNRPSREQEALIKAALGKAGMTHVKRPKGGINLISDLEEGTYTDETVCGSRKADIPGRLHDGRLLLIEAKVSGTTLNSFKRLINDSCTKAPHWREHFGAGAVVPVSVLSGAFTLDQLRLAQGTSYRMFLIWDHALEVLTEFCAV